MPLKVNPTTCCLDMVMGPGTGTATVKIAVDDNTAPGTNPVVPTGAGEITIGGGVVAAHNIPVETHSRSANEFTIEAQVGSAVTGAPGNKDAAGLVQFDDTQFAVDADGYVTLVGGGTAIDSFTTDVSGPVVPDGAGSVDVTGTSVFSDGTVANTLTLNVQATANTFLLGAGAGSTATELGPLTDGQLIIGSTGLAPVLGSLTSTDGSVTVTGGAGTIDLSVSASDDAILTLTGDAGGAVSPTAGDIDIQGVTVSNAANSKPVFVQGTPGSSLLEVDVQVSAAITGAPADFNDAGICSFDDTAFDVDANGYVTLKGGAGPTVDTFTTDVAGPVVPDGSGIIDVTGTSVFSDGTVANTLTLNVQATANTFLLGAGAGSTATELGPLTNGQLIIGSTGVSPVLGNITSTDGSVTITNGAGSIDLAVAAADDAILTLTGDTGGALSPTAGNINILGGPGVTVTGAGSTLTVNSVVYTDQASSTSVISDSGSFSTAAITLTLPSSPVQGERCEFVATTTDDLIVTAAGTQVVHLGSVSSTAGGTLTSTDIGDSLSLIYQSATDDWWALNSVGVWVVA